MGKLPWMREIEIEMGLRDLWVGAWHYRAGRWSRAEVLADTWEWSNLICSCCREPFLVTPDNQFLVCQWGRGSRKRINPPMTYIVAGISIFPCLGCHMRVFERRIIDGLTMRTRWIKVCDYCGLDLSSDAPIETVDYLPPGWSAKHWRQPTEYEQINGKLDEIKQLLLKE